MCLLDKFPETMSTPGDGISHDGEIHWDSSATFTPGRDPEGTMPGWERAQTMMGSSDNEVAEVDLSLPDNTRRFGMLPPLSRSDNTTLLTDSQVLSRIDGRDIRRHLRSIRLRMNAVNVVQTAEVLGRVPSIERPSKEDASDAHTKSHAQRFETLVASQPRSLDARGAIREFQLNQLKLRELALNRQASGIDAVELPVVDDADDDHDSSSDAEEDLSAKPATFEFITPPACSRPSNGFTRRVIVRPVRRHGTNASVIVPPDMPDSLNNEDKPGIPLPRRVDRSETVTSLEWATDISDMGFFLAIRRSADPECLLTTQKYFSLFCCIL